MEKNIFEKTFDCADEQAIDLLKNMLVLNSSRRLNIDDILQHPFLADDKSYIEVNLPI